MLRQARVIIYHSAFITAFHTCASERTGESLLQVSGLQDTHPDAARVAAEAAAIVLREPVRSEAQV